jgi:hypothetical protein
VTELIRYRFNTMAGQTPGGEWKWRVIFERTGIGTNITWPATEVFVCRKTAPASLSRSDSAAMVYRKGELSPAAVDPGLGRARRTGLRNTPPKTAKRLK